VKNLRRILQFLEARFTIDGKYYATSEHYFQAQKFVRTEHEEIIRLSRAPKVAADRGRERSRPLRADWNEVKEDVMRRALRAKFTAHAPLRELLLSTGDEEIVENAPGDLYWGQRTRRERARTGWGFC
jgi:ribA/ribD-fused uncharacterized protein